MFFLESMRLAQVIHLRSPNYSIRYGKLEGGIYRIQTEPGKFGC